MFNFTRLLNVASKHLNWIRQYQVFQYPMQYYNFNTRNCEWIVCKIHKSYTPQLTILRPYAKSKDRKKEKGKAKVQINETQLSEIIDVEVLKNQFQKPIEILKEEFVKNLSIRTASSAIENLSVSFDGRDYTLQELGQVIKKNPTMTVVNMSIFPQVIPAVIKAFQKSGMNLNPQQDGTTLYIPIPKVTKEHRENLAKNAKQLFIKCRDSIKDAQVKYSKGLKKKQNVSEDVIAQTELQIITLADSYINQAQTIYDTKSSLMETRHSRMEQDQGYKEDDQKLEHPLQLKPG